MGKEHLKHPSIYKDYEDWEIEQLEPHEPIHGKNRQLSIEHGLYMYIDREFHTWLHIDERGIKLNNHYKTEMQEKWMEHNNKTVEEFIEIFGKNYLGCD